MADYLVTSLGSLPRGFWTCLDCPAKGRTRYMIPASEGVRDAAVEHIGDTGHTVAVFRGSEEILTGLRYQHPEPLVISG